MTNKTITLSRELVERIVKTCPFTLLELDYQELRVALAEPVPPAVSIHPISVDETGYGMVMPPAGGEPEVYAYMVRKPNGSDHLDFENEYPSDSGYKISELIRREDHRAHVTRLQAEVTEQALYAASEARRACAAEAEVERLQDQLADAKATANLAVTNLEEFKEDHRYELTKARELLREASRAPEWSLSVDLQVRISNYLSNQSALADKGQGGPLSELEVLRAAVKELEAMRDARVDAKLANGEPVAWQIRTKTNRVDSNWTEWTQCSEMERALHSHEVGKFNRFGIMREIRPLYAEQPAPPVAVVIPQDEKLMETVERYPNGDPLEYDAALRKLKQ